MGDKVTPNPNSPKSSILLTKLSSDELTLEPILSSKLQFVHFAHPNIANLVLRGKIPMMRPPEHYSLPDPEQLEAGVHFVEQWMLENKVIRRYETEKRLKTRLLAKHVLILALTSSCVCDPGAVDGVTEFFLTEEGLSMVAGLQLIFVVDDIIEESDLFGRHESVGPLAYKYVAEMLKGNSALEFDPDKNMFPSLRPAAKAAQKILQTVQTNLPDFLSKSLEFQAAVKATFLGVYLLQAADKSKNESKPEVDITKEIGDEDAHADTMPETTFMCLRRADVAALPPIEALLYLRRVELALEIRENLLFKRYLEVVQSIVAYQNDLLGLEKDVKSDEVNIVLFKMKKYGSSLQDAFKAAIEQVQVLVEEFVYLESRLRRLFKDTEGLETFFECVHTVVDALGYLMVYTERYGDLRAAFLISEADASLDHNS